MAELLTGVGIVLGLLVIIILIIIFSTLFMVQQQTMAIIERFGKFRRTAGAGLHIRAPFGIDRVIQRVHLRIKQNNIEIETKTKDNVLSTLISLYSFK